MHKLWDSDEAGTAADSEMNKREVIVVTDFADVTL